jgi:cytochrome P450
MLTVLMNGGKEGMPPFDWNVIRSLMRFPLRTRMSAFAFPKARNLIAEDAGVHDAMRSAVNRGFTPHRVAALEPRVRALVAESLASLRPGEDFDVVRGLAIPLPVTIIAEMVGVEPERHLDFKRWSGAFIDGVTGPGRARPFAPAFTDAVLEFLSYVRSVVRERRFHPDDDLINTTLADAPGGHALSDMEVMLFVQLLLVAGNETTSNLIGNALHALLDHPAELERVRRDPGLVPGLARRERATPQRELVDSFLVRGPRSLVLRAAA